jgi:virginiamycin B lyase
LVSLVWRCWTALAFVLVLAATAQPSRTLAASTRGTVGASKAASCQAAPGSENLAYRGGPIMHSETTHLVFWEAPGYHTAGAYKATLAQYLQDVAAASGERNNVYWLLTQYCDKSGPAAYQQSFAGTLVDSAPYPNKKCPGTAGPPCITDKQLKKELRLFTERERLPTGMNQLYVVALPPLVHSCLDMGTPECSGADYCAYHSWSGKNDSAIIYAVLPQVSSLTVPGCDPGQRPSGTSDEGADATLNALEHEQMEAITDPTSKGWRDSSGLEIGDKCVARGVGPQFGSPIGGAEGAYFNQEIGGGHYWVQQEWSNRTSACAAQPPVPSAQATPASPMVDQNVTFDATRSTASSRIVRSAWDFGDGTMGEGSSVTHAYTASGAHTVSLTVEDANGLATTTTLTVNVLAAVGLQEFSMPGENTDPDGITVGPEKNVWATEAQGKHVAKVEPNGAITEYTVPNANWIFRIAPGPDKNLWFTDLYGNFIGKITPNGTVTEYPLPEHSFPEGITEGADGRMWIGEQTNQFVAITTTGAITQYALPSHGRVREVTRGTDGAIWFTWEGGVIGRINPRGEVSEISLPAGSGPIGITTAPDGDLWVAEWSLGQVASVDPSTHEVRQYTLPEPLRPWNITATSDGSIWLTALTVPEEAGTGVIVQMDPTSGNATIRSRFPRAAPDDITAGPDGALWFTEFWGEKIGRLFP